ncbi:hypothetical protein GF359_01870 [candidate division WOR-3 bacterium]|uniref:Disease resistance R13L4/SHOC-2-like LRR domain-containing protein n=1 Tax=candidate division WOR-3 bacterium TaxID=2052148 RepID=A0A9D5QCF9_UNCW3|nr:hypothetical protein [candidate division WOR-3 bacterium]MBD3363941.1 hypothetical protein [candidate division WOR-3 bacterium]
MRWYLVMLFSLVIVSVISCGNENRLESGREYPQSVVLIYEGKWVTDTSNMDVSWLEPGKDAIYLQDPEESAGFYYPWSGEDTIRYFYDYGLLYVDSQLVGFNLVYVKRQKLDSLDLSNVTAIHAGEGLDDKLISMLSSLKVIMVPSEGEMVFTTDTTTASPPSPLTYLDVIPTNTAIYVTGWDGSLRPLLRFPDVRELTLWGSCLRIRDLKFLTRMKNLRCLRINSLEIPNSGLRHIHRLPNLIVLNLTFTDVGKRGARYIGKMKHLKELTINEARFGDKGLKHISRSKSLERLSIGSLYPWTLREIAEDLKGDKWWWYLGGADRRELLKHLRSVFMPVPTGKGWRHLSRLKNLRYLSISNYELDAEGTLAIGNLEGLEDLHFYSIELDNESVDSFSGLGGLKYFSCNRGNLDDRWLQYLSKRTPLEYLFLINTDITRDGLENLAGMEELKTLDLIWIWPEDEGYEPEPYFSADLWALIAGMDSLENLCVRGTEIDNKSLGLLAESNSLKSLTFEMTNLEGEGLKRLSRVPNLEELHLWHVEIENADFRYLLEFPKLTLFRHWTMEVDDAGMNYLKCLHNLKRLWLDFEPAQEAELKRALPGCLVGYY